MYRINEKMKTSFTKNTGTSVHSTLWNWPDPVLFKRDFLNREFRNRVYDHNVVVGKVDVVHHPPSLVERLGEVPDCEDGRKTWLPAVDQNRKRRSVVAFARRTNVVASCQRQNGENCRHKNTSLHCRVFLKKLLSRVSVTKMCSRFDNSVTRLDDSATRIGTFYQIWLPLVLSVPLKLV